VRRQRHANVLLVVHEEHDPVTIARLGQGRDLRFDLQER
jgi:hypothetical protein